MHFKKLIHAANALLKAKILKIKTPLVVGWGITDRCNRKCLYCARWQGKIKELSTNEVFKIIDTLTRLGTLRISFTGGEPLMREDMGKIIDYVHSKGIEARLNSNGSLVVKRISDLKNLDILNLSLEGEKEIHDAIRGEGSYEEVIEAAKIAKGNDIKVTLTAVLTKININSADFVIDKAREMDTKVTFQPTTQLILGGKALNPIVPSKEQYRKAVEKLISKKKNGERAIGNSMAGLKHLYNWPDPKRIRCASGWISCRIEPDGGIFYCSRKKKLLKPVSSLSSSFWKEFSTLGPVSCNDCWCAGRAELNLAFWGNLSVIHEQIKSVFE